MSKPLTPDDPCYFMLERGRKNPMERSASDVYREGCYICEDDEFSLMGLPLCYQCCKCGGHVAADDSRCDDCGADQQPEPPQ